MGLLPVRDSIAEIYKYQKDGVWYFTDSPSEELPKESQVIAGDNETSSYSGGNAPPILENYPARTDIERATKATVAVKTPIGYGSGFFISTHGHIITNKHVVRSIEKQSAQTEQQFDQIENKIQTYDRQFNEERRRLQAFEAKLYQMKREIDSQTHSERNASAQAQYQSERQRYEAWQKDFQRRYQAYQKEKQTYFDSKHEYKYSTSVANLAQTFTIILVDETELYARLIQVSSDHDLALLKIDGYTTPALTPYDGARLIQGQSVYAIGNPVKLQNSVTSGVFSGFEKGFLQTNAQIYPGNSGGPLVDEKGNVLGINTFKQLTHKYEGLGFAIPIRTALSEFSSHLPGR